MDFILRKTRLQILIVSAARLGSQILEAVAVLVKGNTTDVRAWMIATELQDNPLLYDRSKFCDELFCDGFKHLILIYFVILILIFFVFAMGFQTYILSQTFERS